MNKIKMKGKLTAQTLPWCFTFLLSAVCLTVPASVLNQSKDRDKSIQIPGALRQVHITSTTVGSARRGKKYEIDLRLQGVAYDLNPKPGSIEYSRLMVRTASGITPIAQYLKEKLPQVDLRGWESKRVQLMTLSGKSGEGKSAAKNPGLPRFSCTSLVCSCIRHEDCGDMFATNLCSDFVFCDADTDKCYCSRE